MYSKYVWYKILRLCRLLSEIEFKRKVVKYSKAYKLLVRSKLFDAKWYSKEYPLIKNTGLSPIEHYLNFGFKEDKLPHKNFDANKIFQPPYPKKFYGLEGKRNISLFYDKHDPENMIESYQAKSGKILLFSHELSLTGAPRALLNLAKNLQQMGVEPVIISPFFGDIEHELRKYNIEYYVEPLLLMKLLFQDKKLRSFFQSFDLILFNTLVSLRYVKYINSQAKKIAWIHEVSAAYDREDASYDLAESFSLLNKVYSISKYSKSFTDRYIKSTPSEVLSCGFDKIDTSKFTRVAKGSQERISFLLIGRCSEEKGHLLLINALSCLPQKIKDSCSFKIIGPCSGKFYKKHKTTFQKLGISCIGQLSHYETLEEIYNTDILLCPSLFESLSIVCIEAMQLQKVVIVSNATGVADYIEDEKNGYIFNLECDKLEDIIIKVYQNKQHFASLGSEAYTTFNKNFTQVVFQREIQDKILSFI